MIHEVRLRADDPKHGYAPPEPVSNAIRHVPGLLSQAVRMGFQGASTVRGQKPRWLRAMSDVRLVGVDGQDEPIIRFDAPQFGDVAEGLYSQLQMALGFPRPGPEDTGFDLLGDLLSDLAAHERDSARFDHQLLGRVLRFRRVLDGHFQQMLITARRYPSEKPAVMDKAVITTAGEFYEIIPSPVRARMVGVLDRLEASTRSFTVLLDDGARAHGVLAEGEIDELASLFHRRVLVLGEAAFRPSGRFLRVDAEHVSLAVNELPIWSELPEPSDARVDIQTLHMPHGRKRGLAAVVGQWPGDETDEEIAELLRELS